MNLSRKLIPLALVTALLAACTSTGAGSGASGGGGSSALDANGYIRNWLLLGPIAFGDTYNAEDISKEQIPNEAKMTPKAGDKVSVTSQEGEPGSTKPVKRELTWQAVKLADYFFDFNETFKLDATDAMGGYAVAYVDAPAEMTGITFSLCSNDNGEVYLNGKSVYHFVGGRGLSEDADTVENLTLKKGANVIIFKVWNDSNNWQGCLRLLNKDGKPVNNVKVRLSK